MRPYPWEKSYPAGVHWDAPVRTMTLPDKFQDHDKPERMYAAAGLDAKGIVAKAIAALGDVEHLVSSRSA